MERFLEIANDAGFSTQFLIAMLVVGFISIGTIRSRFPIILAMVSIFAILMETLTGYGIVSFFVGGVVLLMLLGKAAQELDEENRKKAGQTLLIPQYYYSEWEKKWTGFSLTPEETRNVVIPRSWNKIAGPGLQGKPHWATPDNYVADAADVGFRFEAD